MRSRWAAALLGLGIVLVGAGCGDTDGGDADGPSSSDSPAVIEDVVEYEFTGADPVMAEDDRGVFAASDGLLYLLGPAEVTGDALANASARFQEQWLVDVEFDTDGGAAFGAMAARHFGNQVAIVLDGGVVSAPLINATEFDGVAVIAGAFDEGLARDLAVALNQNGSILEFRPVLDVAEDTDEGRAALEAALRSE